MNLTDKPLPNPVVVLRDDLDDYVLLFEPSIGQVVGLDAVGVATWRAIDGQRIIADIADVVRAQFDNAPPSIIADVRAFIADLERQLFVLTEPLTVIDFPSPGDFGSLNRPPRLNGEIYTLALADGTRLALGAEDATAARVVAKFAAWMRRAPATTLDGFRRVRVITDDSRLPKFSETSEVYADDDTTCVLQPTTARRWTGRQMNAQGQVELLTKPLTETEWLWQQLAHLTAFIGRATQPRGGLAIHGALALTPDPSPDEVQSGEGSGVRGEVGVLLSGRSGIGKTTASRRLPLPWVSLCDDATLIVRDDAGTYWAHPLPTWSKLFEENGDGSHDVQRAVPLRAIFILDQAPRDRVTPVGTGQAVSLLMEVAEQAAQHLWRDRRVPPDELRVFHTQRFENLIALARALPTHILAVSLTGAFWREMERALNLRNDLSAHHTNLRQ